MHRFPAGNIQLLQFFFQRDGVSLCVNTSSSCDAQTTFPRFLLKQEPKDVFGYFLSETLIDGACGGSYSQLCESDDHIGKTKLEPEAGSLRRQILCREKQM